MDHNVPSRRMEEELEERMKRNQPLQLNSIHLKSEEKMELRQEYHFYWSLLLVNILLYKILSLLANKFWRATFKTSTFSNKHRMESFDGDIFFETLTFFTDIFLCLSREEHFIKKLC